MRSAYFEVTGGEPIQGSIAPQGNKNEALPALAACCLTEEALTFKNLPQIEDVDLMKKILKHLGADVEEKNGSVKVQAKKDLSSEIPRDLSAQLRGSVTLAGPLLARCGRVFLPKPGGDRIGRRRLDTHILALQELGAKISVHPDGFEIEADRLVGADIWLDEASVTATENAVLAATLAKGETVIRNAASEPHVQGLCHLLIKMGAKIDGVGSNILRVQGVDRLKGAAHRIGPDYLEVGSFIALAAVTGGELLIQDAGVENLRMIRMMFSKLGIETRVQGDDLFVPSAQSMEIISDLGGAIPSIDDAPWPGFPADMTSVALVTATQCKGTILIHEKMFESRLYFTDHLIGMGARIVLCDPHRAVIIGPEKLKGSTLTSPDIRAGMALLIAALCAEGTSIIQNIVQIDRGFADIDARLRLLGAKIERHNHSKR
ncbi:MAG: UDP-N-acetylglucosamine 1-carboxyvinyltransferase [Verrucomicrobiota bacterium]